MGIKISHEGAKIDSNFNSNRKRNICDPMEPQARANKKSNYEQEILGCLENKTMGLTVTNITNLLGISRNTVSKYLAILELQHLIDKQDIGAYRFYFSKNTSGNLPSSLTTSFIKGFLAGLKKIHR